MRAPQTASWRAAVAARWTARVAGTVLVLFFLAFFFGEGPPDLSRLTSVERFHLLCFAALFLGLVIAWKWEGAGGLISVASFACLWAIDAAHVPNWLLGIAAIAGAVHIACWSRLRISAPAGLVAWRLPRGVLISLLAALAVFLLLCANEIFGQPPLMTPTLHPDRQLLGDWYNAPSSVSATNSLAVEVVIHSDGSLTGAVGDAAVTAGRITYGRTWFGRLLNINAPYRITGTLSGERFIMPLEARGDVLDGSLFLRNRPMRLVLSRRPNLRLQP